MNLNTKQDDNLLFVHLGVRNDIEGFRLVSACVRARVLSS